jgi:hypothetical protein
MSSKQKTESRRVKCLKTLFLLVIALCRPVVAASRQPASRRLSTTQAHRRRLLQHNAKAIVRVANFSGVDITQAPEVLLQERALEKTVHVTGNTDPVQYGAYPLDSKDVLELHRIITDELVRFR